MGLEKLMAQSRIDGKPVMVLFLDINGMKEINDGDGGGHHNEGDFAINSVASILRHLRFGDIAARFGGDEFGVASRVDSTMGEKIIERIRKSVGVIELPVTKRHFSISVGQVVWDERESVDWLLNRADKLMYEEKPGWKTARGGE